MKAKTLLWAMILGAAVAGAAEEGTVIFERVSAYHHIQVLDDAGLRRLSFNGSWETKMSLADPLQGHFEYTEYFQMPWLWNPDIRRVLMAGLGGGSTQRAYQHYYTNVLVDTVEIDPVVVGVAEQYFFLTNRLNLQIHTNDARVFLRRTTNVYDVIIMDAYATTRYGSSLPAQLTTQEFFKIASDHLGTNGVLAYNVIGQIYGYRASVIGAMWRTMKTVFPQVYLFPADGSRNIVMIATKSSAAYDAATVRRKGEALVNSGKVTFPGFASRLQNFDNEPPPNARNSPLLTDDYAPLERLLQTRW